MGYYKIKAIFQIFLIITAIFTLSLLDPNTSSFAAAAQNGCCEQTISGEYCQYTEQNNCEPGANFQDTTCDKTSYCKPQCCVDDLYGTCSKNVPAALCQNTPNMTVNSNSDCQIPICERGCCQIGGQCSLETESSCSRKASQFPDIDQSAVFDASISGEVSCVNQCQEETKGCCVTPGETCAFTSGTQCGTFNSLITDGTEGFYPEIICSDPKLSCNCAPQSYKGCTEENDDVYWFDSCGNREEVVEGCDTNKGTICEEHDGTASCQSTNCDPIATFKNPQGQNMNPHLGNKKAFKSGESWCTYESGVGLYLDRPGSRHYRHICMNGEELVEPCRDYREEVCVQFSPTIQGKKITESQCIDNGVHNKKFTPEVTTVPQGLKFWGGKSQTKTPLKSSERTCEVADVECTVIYTKPKLGGSWECMAGCDCEEQEWIDNAAIFCSTRGDCGAGINILGKSTDDGFEVAWSGSAPGPRPDEISDGVFEEWEHYGVFGGLEALAESFEEDAENYEIGAGEILKDFAIEAVATAIAGGVVYSSAVGALTYATSEVGAGTAFYQGASNYVTQGINTVFGEGTVNTFDLGADIAGEAAELTGQIMGTIAILYGAYKFVTALFEGDVVGMVSGLGTIAAGIALILGETIIGLVIAIVVIIFELIFGGVEVATKEVETSCHPWVPPAGGSDCKKCDDDPFKPCTEYRCEALGAACDFINVGTGKETCASKDPTDITPPKIKPWDESVTPGYTVNLQSNGYALSPKIQPYTALTFGVKLDEYAQCKLDTKPTQSYDEMSTFFGDPIYEQEKNVTLLLPGGKDYTYYVRCRDTLDNVNINEYHITFATSDEPDMTPPVILATLPANGAFIPAGSNQTYAIFYLNEPTQYCRYDKIDKDLGVMPEENLVACTSYNANLTLPPEMVTPTTYVDYTCYVILKPVVENSDNPFYVRCLDLEGNANTQGYLYNLKAAPPLTIISKSPLGTLYDASPTLRVATANGAEHGIATCFYQAQGAPLPTEFFNTHSNVHEQPFVNLTTGDYDFTITCVDAATNKINETIQFTLDAPPPDQPPLIRYIYASLSTLTVITNEPTTCAYSLTDYTFLFEHGKNMTGQHTLEHEISEFSPIYYITCEDAGGNTLQDVTVYR